MSAPLLLRSLKGEAIERFPVWMMRQAGRYMAEYREVKARHGFLGICKSPELTLEVTMQPMRAFNPDAAIIFADIMLPVEGMGLSLTFDPGPKLENPIRAESDVKALRPFDPYTQTAYLLDAIRLVKAELGKHYADREPRALLGFAGAPYTMACYMIDQGPFKQHLGAQVFAAAKPAAMAELMERLTEALGDYLQAQVEQGVDAVQLFDTWAGNLRLEDYKRLAQPYNQRLIERIQKLGCPVVLYANGASHLLGELAAAGADCLSIDWRTPLAAASSALPKGMCLQGNFDPTLLFASRESVIERTNQMLAAVGRKTSYIVNLGHGILPTTPVENVAAFVESVKSYRLG